ncbi:MAG: HD-GYP domain-containing protein [Lachnospiraceae bacterium]|nr:HD-GYP domain-containing protein [Lachnospiraceae bacterium]
MYYTFLIIDYAALIIIAASMFVVDIQQSSYSQKLMSSICSWCCFITFGFCIRMTNSSLESQILGQKIVYLSFIHVLFYMLLFVFDFCHKTIPPHIQLSITMNNLVMSVLTLFLDKHNLFYTSMWLEENNNIVYFRRTYGPLHTIYYGEMLIYLIAMLWVLIQNMQKSRRTRRSSVLLMISILFPFIGYFVQKMNDFPYEFTPGCFIISVCIMMELIYVEKIYNVNDVARDYIFDSMDSAFIVTDVDYGFKGCNDLAKMIFPELSGLNQDDDLYPVSSAFRQIMSGNTNPINYNGKMYSPSVKRITSGKSTVAVVVTLNDITSQYEYKALQDGYREELEAEVEKQTKYAEQRHKKVEEMSVQLVQTLANAIDAKDKYTNGHSSRVAEYSVRLATALGWDKEAIDILRYEGLLHDVGKIGISDIILNKASTLSDDEFDILKDHVTIGGDIMHDASTLPGAENVIRYHHERYDGSGYPEGLKGEQIPIDARIVSIVDTFDAMSSNRIYRKALSRTKIREEMLKGKGKQFDPGILDVFISLFDRGLLDDVAPRDNGWFD